MSEKGAAAEQCFRGNGAVYDTLAQAGPEFFVPLLLVILDASGSCASSGFRDEFVATIKKKEKLLQHVKFTVDFYAGDAEYGAKMGQVSEAFGLPAGANGDNRIGGEGGVGGGREFTGGCRDFIAKPGLSRD